MGKILHGYRKNPRLNMTGELLNPQRTLFFTAIYYQLLKRMPILYGFRSRLLSKIDLGA